MDIACGGGVLATLYICNTPTWPNVITSITCRHAPHVRIMWKIQAMFDRQFNLKNLTAREFNHDKNYEQMSREKE